MKNKTLTGLVLALSAAFGCTKDITDYDLENPPNIVNKLYKPETSYQTNDQVLVGMMPVGKVFIPIYTPGPEYTMIDDEDFIFYIKTRTSDEARIYVSREVWDSKNIGDKLDLRKIRYETSDPEYRSK